MLLIIMHKIHVYLLKYNKGHCVFLHADLFEM